MSVEGWRPPRPSECDAVPCCDGRAARTKFPARRASATDFVTPSRRRFAGMLREAFGAGAFSNNEIARRAAPVLGVSPRQVLNWLTLEHSAKGEHHDFLRAMIGRDLSDLY